MSNWWDPNTSGYFDVGDLSAILLLLTTAVSIVIAISRWWMKQLKKVINEEISEATRPIQPTANGGLSLPDVARKVDRLENTLEQVMRDNLETRDIILQVLVDKEIKTKKPRSNKSA